MAGNGLRRRWTWRSSPEFIESRKPKINLCQASRLVRMMASDEEDDLDFSQVPDAAVDEFYRQAELCLQSTVQIAIAADSRATTLTGTFGAATAALLVLAANIGTKDKIDFPLLIAILSGASSLLVASVFSATVARPVEFHIPGYHPRVLYVAASSEKHIKLEAATDIQKRIDQNSAYLGKAAKTLSRGRVLALLSVPISIISFLLSSHWDLVVACVLALLHGHLR